MILSEFNQPAGQKIAKLNTILREQFGVSVKTNYPSKKKLETVLETANMAVVKLRTSNKKFQLDADYAKFLGIRDIVETMLAEGMYAESPSYRAMKKEMTDKVRDLMDKGYSDEEACAECMNQYRMDPRFAFDDEHVKGLVATAAKEFMEQCMTESDEDMLPSAPVAQGAPVPQGTKIARDVIARHLGYARKVYTNKLANGARTVKMYSTGDEDLDQVIIDDISAALKQAGVTNFSVHRFQARANGGPGVWRPKPSIIVTLQPEVMIDESDSDADECFYPNSTLIRTEAGHAAAEVFQKKDGSWASYDHFSDRELAAVDMEDAVDGAIQTALLYSNEAMVNPLTRELVYPEDQDLTVEGRVNLGHLLQEEVDVEQAEVVMAVRALADDIQDQVERLGRMINEEVPAIADQIRGEMGATESQSFYDQMSQIINAHLENTRNTKTEMDTVVAQLSGQAPAAPNMVAPAMSASAELPAEAPADADVEMNEPVNAGPEDAPLGRAKV